MAKFHYVQRQKFHLAQVASMPGTAPNATFTASRAATDTMVRSLWSPQLVSQIDPTINPPVTGWWVDAEVQLSMRFEKGGVAGPGGGPFLASTFGTVKLYPTYFPDSALDATSYVVWTPKESPTVIETARKGLGTFTPFVNVSMWAADFHGTFANPGGGFSVKHSVNWTGTVVWASDVP